MGYLNIKEDEIILCPVDCHGLMTIFILPNAKSNGYTYINKDDAEIIINHLKNQFDL